MFTSVRTKHKQFSRRIPKNSYSDYSSSRSASGDSLSDISLKCSTPYRLPRLPSENDEPIEREIPIQEVEKVYGRFGYEYVVRLPELKPLTPSEFIATQRLLAQKYRQVSLVPRLRATQLSPIYRNTPSPELENNEDNFDTTRFQHINVGSEIMLTTRSNSVQWKLGQPENCNFDVTGLSHMQGPFSRSFKVRCRPPPCWMTMKWGRSRTIVV